MEDEKEELEDKLRATERKNEEMGAKLQDLEREVRGIMNEREREGKDNTFARNLNLEGGRFKDENKTRMLDDIQNMIRTYKLEKNLGKSGAGGVATFIRGNDYSTHSSGYYQ